MPRPIPDWMHRHPKSRYLINRWIAQPEWADTSAMNRIYEQSLKQGGHVDHIVPLCSPIVCGLHVEHNLQILPAGSNYSKSNHIWPDMPGEPMHLDIPRASDVEQYALPL